MRGGAAQKDFASVDAFLAWEEQQPERYEFLDGAVWPVNGEPSAMAGGSITHNDLVFNLRTALLALFRPRGCRVQSENVKLRTDSFSAYPDVMVLCGPVAGRESTVTEALLVAEVLSEGTERRDRSIKQQAYLNAPFLKLLLLVSQDTQVVEVYTRQGDGWAYRIARGPDGAVELPAVDARLAMADLYRDTDVPPPGAVLPFRPV